MKIAVIGYGTAGMTAAIYAKLTCRKSEVEVFEKRPYAVYHPCSLPDAIAGLIPLESIIEEKVTIPGINVRTSTVVEEIDTEGRKLKARDLKSGEVLYRDYDNLILATGSRPFIPRSVNILESSCVYTLRLVEDAKFISEAATKYNSVVVVGGSALGIETAYALKIRGLNVTLVEYFHQLMPGKLDFEIAKIVAEKLSSKGINLMLGEGVVEVSGAPGTKKVTTSSGRELETGFVVFATGIKPDIDLAKQIGAEIGQTGGIKVDEHMRTSIDGVYAAGDVAEVRDLITGKPTLSQFANTALIMGRIAGINAVGGDTYLRGVLQNWIVNLEGFKFGSVGLTEEKAKKAGIDVVSVSVTAMDKPLFYPGSENITVKLIANSEGKLIGVQVVGGGNVVEKLNVLSASIFSGMTVSDLPYLEFAYVPSLNEVVHPIYTAADALLRRLQRKAKIMQ
ncbi:MAG: FAD-dependent oxidoreductase [Thermofilaceae archaeon]